MKRLLLLLVAVFVIGVVAGGFFAQNLNRTASKVDAGFQPPYPTAYRFVWGDRWKGYQLTMDGQEILTDLGPLTRRECPGVNPCPIAAGENSWASHSWDVFGNQWDNCIVRMPFDGAYREGTANPYPNEPVGSRLCDPGKPDKIQADAGIGTIRFERGSRIFIRSGGQAVMDPEDGHVFRGPCQLDWTGSGGLLTNGIRDFVLGNQEALSAPKCQ